MNQPLDPATRPSRLSPIAQTVVLGLLVLSFLSGVMVWWGLNAQETTRATPAWLHPMLVFHGGLNPFLCAVFGYLVCHHIRIGWQLKANLLSGFAMEAVFAGLILTGVGLYYTADWRDEMVWCHRILGLLWPATMALHWWAAVRWARRVQEN